MKTIAVLYGGKSGEHEVSLMSAAGIVKHLDKNKYKVVLIGVAKSGEWLLQADDALHSAGGNTNPGPAEGSVLPESSAATMNSMPPVAAGPRVFVAPGAGLFVENGAGASTRLDCDIVFPVLHGTFGEDGIVQGLLECAGLPYVGAGVLGSAIGMDKQVAKELWLHEGLPVVDFISVHARDREGAQAVASLARKIEARFGWPCFIKPACSGSSVGTSKVAGPSQLESALDKAFAYDEKVLVEQFVNAREIECSVLGNEKPRAFPPGEIVPNHEFYDYAAKYKDPQGATLRVPASLSSQQVESIQSCALRAYKACELSGMARVDFFIDKLTGKVLLNELNTIPGFTSISMYPLMCEAGGLAYPDLLDELLELAMDRYRRRNSLSYSFEVTS